MDVKEEKICRLCFNVTGNECELIDKVTREMLDNLLQSKINLGISKDPVMCNECSDVIKKSSYFKTVCISKEQLMPSFSNDVKGTKLELKNTLEYSEGTEIVEQNFGECRFCRSQLNGINFASIDSFLYKRIFADFMVNFIPEVDFNMIKNSVICTGCRQSLEFYFKFVQDSLDIEHKINRYCQEEGANSIGQIDLNHLLNFLLNDNFRYIERCTQIQGTKPELRTLEDQDLNYIDELIKSEPLDNNDVSTNQSICNNPIETTTQDEQPNIATDVYKCTLCSYEGVRKDLLKRHHRRTHQAPLKSLFKCTICEYQTRFKHHFQYHMLIHKDQSEVEMYKCTFCIYETKRKDQLKVHMLTDKHSTKIKMYKCTQCNYETKYIQCLRRHRLTHMANSAFKTHKCTLCSYITKYKRNLNTHILRHKSTSEVEMYKCAMCTYESKIKESLKVHIQKMHVKSKKHIKKITSKVTPKVMYKCTICTFETNSRAYLQARHMLTHNTSEVYLYKCAECPYGTNRKDNLKRHMLSHMDASEVQMFKCTICTFETKYKKNLLTHIVVHKDASEVNMYRCTVCTYVTKHRSCLRDHMLIHKDISETVMHKCETCSFETKYKNNLNKHIARHRSKLGVIADEVLIDSIGLEEK